MLIKPTNAVHLNCDCGEPEDFYSADELKSLRAGFENARDTLFYLDKDEIAQDTVINYSILN